MNGACCNQIMALSDGELRVVRKIYGNMYVVLRFAWRGGRFRLDAGQQGGRHRSPGQQVVWWGRSWAKKDALWHLFYILAWGNPFQSARNTLPISALSFKSMPCLCDSIV